MPLPRLPVRRLIVPGLFVLMIAGALLPADGAIGRGYQAVTRPMAHLVETVLKPGSHAFRWIGSAIRFDERPLIVSEDLAEANREILQRRAQVIALEQRVAELERENAELRNLEHFYRRTSYRPIRARVTGASLDSRSRTITLNRGRAHGFVEGLPIAYGPSLTLVGRVIDAGEMTATVALITTPQWQLEAVILPRQWQQGEATPERVARRLDRIAQFEPVGPQRLAAVVYEDMAVDVGDLVHLKDSRWPGSAQGLVIGEVVEVEPMHDPQLRKRVIVEPRVELAHVPRVWGIATEGGEPIE